MNEMTYKPGIVPYTEADFEEFVKGFKRSRNWNWYRKLGILVLTVFKRKGGPEHMFAIHCPAQSPAAVTLELMTEHNRGLRNGGTLRYSQEWYETREAAFRGLWQAIREEQYEGMIGEEVR